MDYGRWWKRLNYRLSNRVIVRVLPVVAFSLVGAGLLGGNIWLDQSRESRRQTHTQTLAGMFAHTAQKAALAALTFDQEFPDTKSVKAAVVVAPGKDGISAVGSAWYAPDVTGPYSEAAVKTWIQDNTRYLGPQVSLGSWVGARLEPGPSLITRSGGQSTYLFPPDLFRMDNNGPAVAWQPVLIRQEEGTPAGHTLLFLDLPSLFDNGVADGWCCLLDGQDQVLWSSRGRLKVGSLFKEQEQEQQQAGILPWLVTRAEGPGKGSTLLLVDTMPGASRALMNFAGVMLFLVVLTIAVVVWGIQAAAGGATRQIENLTENMESLARGEYSGRMESPGHNEIGNLVGYFNLMAVSLDEAQRQVKGKAAHLQAALENMRLLDKAKDNFLVLISHEVRTPLTAIMGGVDYLRRTIADVDEAERQVLDRLNVSDITEIIQHSGERLRGFINDAIQMTTLGSSEYLLRLEQTPVGRLMDESLLAVSHLAAKKNVSLANQLHDTNDWFLLCDSSVLRKGLAKLLENAVVHNRKDGVVIIREAAEVPGRGHTAQLVSAEGIKRLEGQPTYQEFEDEEITWRLLEVFNTGEPIPEDRQEALFGKFDLVEPIENHQRGTGLSLPIAKAALECHGGGIFLNSNGKDGNSFYLLVPTLVCGRLSSQEALSRHDLGHSGLGSAWNEEIGEVADATPFEVELDDQCSRILGGIDEAGGGIDGTRGADHQEKVTVGSQRK